MSQHYNPSLPKVSEECQLELGCFRFGLAVNVAGMDLHSMRKATHIAVIAAKGMAEVAERFSQNELDSEESYQLSRALLGINMCLAIATSLHESAESHRIRRRVAKADKAKAGAA